MTDVAILVPVLGRPHRVEPLVRSVVATAPGACIVFIASPDDVDEHAEIRRVAQDLHDATVDLVVIEQAPAPGDYARKINAGYRATSQSLLFLAADDLEFHPGWLEAATALLSDDVEVVGTNDLGNAACVRGDHSTHTLVTRRYCTERGTVDQADTVLHEGYPHEYVDIEFVETAKARRAWAHAGDSVVEHLHPHWGKAETDVLYDAHIDRMKVGRQLWYKRRRLVRAEDRRWVREHPTPAATRTVRPARSDRTNVRRRTSPDRARATRQGAITVVTASLPTRAQLLRQASATVARQTVDAAHLIGVDAGRGVAELRNQLVGIADTEWVAFLDDDDLLDPHHLDTLLEHAGGYDVVIPHCRFDGPELPTPTCCAGYCNRTYDRDDLRQHGIFPITVLARRDAVLDAGGFTLTGWDDWNLWNAMADAGARFVVVPEVTWTYRTSTTDRRTHQLQSA